MQRGVAVFLSFFVLFPVAAQQSFEELARQAEAATGVRPLEAAALYKQALALRPAWAEGWLYLGATLLELRRFAESREALRKGAELEPGKGTAWAFLGLAEYELGGFPEALSHILKGEAMGLADRPAFVATVRYRAVQMELRNADFTGALEQLRPLVRAGNESPEIIQALGLSALFIASAPEDVPAARQSLVQLAGQAAWAFIAERADRSAPLFAKLIAQYPSEPGVHYMSGVFLLDHDPAAAEAAFREELRVSPHHVLSSVQLALIFLDRGETETARQLAAEAARLEPGNPLCQVTLGRALLSAGSIDPAIAALEKGERLAPETARTHYYLQQAYKRAGRTADAERERTEFNRLRELQEPATVGRSQ